MHCTYTEPMATIQTRIDEKTKKKAQKILAKLGLDLSSAIKMYLVQIIAHQGIPFPILTEKGVKLAAKKRLPGK